MADPTKDELLLLLAEAKLTIGLLNVQLEGFTKGPFHNATLLTKPDSHRLRIVGPGGIVEVLCPLADEHVKPLLQTSDEEKWLREKFEQMLKALRMKFAIKQKVGQRYLVNPQGNIVEEVTSDFIMPGRTHLVSRVCDNGLIELEAQTTGQNGGSQLVYNMLKEPPSPGDQVLCDNSTSAILYNLGKPVPKSNFKLESDVKVLWEDIGGLEDVRRYFEEAFIHPFEHPELYAKHKVPFPKGALLSGPPGNGKTLVAKAMATSFSRNGHSGFFSVKGPEILSMWVGASEQTIRNLFAEARSYAVQQNAPAIIFIDEAEAVMNKRGSGRSSDVDRTIVPSFLTEMDGLNAPGAPVFVLLATNRPELLDPAIVREGRIDIRIEVPRPSNVATEAIFKIHLSKLAINKALTAEELATAARDYLFSADHKLAEIKRGDGTSTYFLLSHVLSGAMIANIANNAGGLARRRDIASHKFTGICLDDLKEAIRSTHNQHIRTPHEEDVKEFTAPFKDDVLEVINAR